MARTKLDQRHLFIVSALLASNLPAPSYSADAETFFPQSLIEDYGSKAGATSNAENRPIVKDAYEMIKHFEGWHSSAYDDPVGYCTIGYGHLIALAKCTPTDREKWGELTTTRGTALLEEDTRSARAAVSSLTTSDLSDHQYSALVVFTYNVGKENFKTSTLLQVVNDGNFKKVGDQLARWVSARGKKLQGLVERRACEAAMFYGSPVVDRNGRFNRAACKSAGIQPPAGSLIDIFAGEY